ncbi:MAG: dipeptidase PepE [Prevotellaceae bacterium]|jgi:dipeptidase E|nr:dipeptidase PepE [Prevotellaceae bacterium]
MMTNNANLLLISNSTNAGEGYLDYCKQDIADFLKEYGVSKALFFPFAAVTFSYDEYERKVQEKLLPLGVEVESIHRAHDAQQAVHDAQAIVVGGGNTFHLLKNIQELKLTEAIRSKALRGTPYVGWSAGSNLACPTICTTNDMPIVAPESLSAFNLIPFQINPHYLDAHPTGHAGETREQRLLEYIAANPHRYVAGLREACMLRLTSGKLTLHGKRTMRVFKAGQPPQELQPADNLQFLLRS